MRIMIVGGQGQLGHELARLDWPSTWTVMAMGRADCDISDPGSISRAMAAVNPDLVINAAAYTAVDRAETEREAAFAVNRDGPRWLARECADRGAVLIHVSTDYVFDGTGSGAYREDNRTAPIGAYGESKEAGEVAVREALERHVILRTSWVFGAHGANFVKTMLRLAATRPELRVVADQHGRPTPAADLAMAIAAMAKEIAKGDGVWGTFHFAGAGATTWHGFAEAIIARSTGAGVARPTVIPITTAEFPTPARRPANSVLDCAKITECYGITPPPWTEGLEQVLRELGALAQG